MRTDNHIPRFTLGFAFKRLTWVTVLVDSSLACAGLAVGHVLQGWRGVVSALCGWLLAFVFCEFNSFIAQILDWIGLKGQSYMAGLIQLWVVKILLAVVIGVLIVIFAPLDVRLFSIMLVVCAAIIVTKNVIISAGARVL